MVSAPAYPDPMRTANAQAGMNRDSVISSALINNYDQYTPWGSVTYNQQGTRGYTDSQGNWVEVPYFSQNVNLSPDQAQTWGNMSTAYQNLSGMAANVSGLLSDYLSVPFDPNYDYSFDTSTATPSSTSWQAYTGGELDNAFDSWYANNYGSNNMQGPTVPGFNSWWTDRTTVDPMTDITPDNFADIAAYARLLDPTNYDAPAFTTTVTPVGDSLIGTGNSTVGNQVTDAAYEATFGDSVYEDFWNQAYRNWAADQDGGTATPAMSRADARTLFMSDYANAQEGDTRFGRYVTTPGRSGTMNRTLRTGPNAINDWQNYQVGDFAAQRQAVEDAIMSRYNTQFANDESAMDAKLRAQGLQPGTEAYKQQYDALSRAKTDARMQAILAGGQEQSRLNALSMQEAAFNNQLRQSKMQEAFSLRSQPINEVIGLLAGSQVNTPQFNAPFQAGVQAPDYMSLVDRQYQAQAQAAQSSASGLFSILGAIPGMFMSDRRAKTDIQRVGSVGKLGVYRFRYLGSKADQFGFMSDEVAPSAVHKIGGVDVVNYREAIAHAG